MDSIIDYRKCDFYHEDELDNLVELQNVVYKERGLIFTKDLLRPWYIDNPDGKVISYNAFDNHHMIGNQLFVPELMLVNGNVVKCLRSMAVVTHPSYRGQGVFTRLTNYAVEEAMRQNYAFIYGIANGNSCHGYVKYCGFSYVTRLEVKMGICRDIQYDQNKTYQRYWTREALKWRLSQRKYYKRGNSIYGSFKPGINTFMGMCEADMLSTFTNLREKLPLGVTLYVGLGAKLPWTMFNVPKFIKHSPFNLIFRDLTDGMLPPMNKDNVFYQLMDFDVA